MDTKQSVLFALALHTSLPQKYETLLVIHVFLSDSHHIFSLTYFHKSPQHQISLKSVQWNRADKCGRTDGHNEAKRRSFFVTRRTRVKIHYHQPSTSSSPMADCMPSIRSASPHTLLPLIGKGDSIMAFLNGTLEECD